jgi:hypothetical protein
VIVDGKFIERDSVIDDAILPEHLKTEAYVAYDLEDRDGKVLLLRDLSFQSVPKPGADGIPTSYPVHVMAGGLLDLSKVPTAHRLKEGLDYATKWTLEEQKQLQKTEEEAYLKQFEAETPAVPR